MLFNRKSHDEGYFYFIASHSQKDIDEIIELARPAESILFMNPMDGATGIASMKSGEKDKVYLQLSPGQSIFVKTFTDKQKTGRRWRYYSKENSPQKLTGDWKIQFISGGPQLPQTREEKELVSWTEWGNPETHRFAGTARYSTTFNAPVSADAYLLDLGRVAESAVVYLNGEKIAALFSSPFTVQLNNLKITNNQLDIEVTNLATNRIRDLDIRQVPWKIFHDINFVNIEYQKFDASTWPVRESGLIGPVTLQPLKLKN